jgi:hypothetical protein
MRDITLRVKIAENIWDQLEEASNELGIRPSTVAAFAIAQWVKQQKIASHGSEAIAREVAQVVSQSLRELSQAEE